MSRLLYTELLKMKGAKMFFISLLGGAVSPVLTFFMLLGYRQQRPDATLTIENIYKQSQLFIAFLIGTMLFALITTYLFNREFEEDTLKNLLTIPVKRSKFIFSKMVVLFIWVEIIMILAYVIATLLGFIGGFEERSFSILLSNLKIYLLTGIYLYMLTPVIVIITLIFKNYVPPIAFSIAASLGSLVIMQSKYISLYPWSIPVALTAMSTDLDYPFFISMSILIILFILSLFITLLYFAKSDID